MDSVFGNSMKLVGDRIVQWIEGFIINIPNLLLAAALIAAFVILSRVAYNLVHSKSVKLGIKNSNLTSLFATTLQVGVLLLGIFLALSVIHLEKTVVSILAGLGIMGIALGFAFQDIASNFMSGLLLAFRSPFRVGDVIEVDGVSGTVSALKLRDTELITFEGQKIFVPNKDVIGNKLKNFSIHQPRRVDLDFGIDYSASIEEAKKLLLNVARKESEVLTEPSPSCVCVELGASSINLKLKVWVKYPGTDVVEVKDRLYVQGKQALDQAKIGIPFATRTIELKNISQLAEALSSNSNFELRRSGQNDSHVRGPTQ